MEQKILGLDGKMYDRPVDIIQSEEDVKQTNMPDMGMIMDGTKPQNVENAKQLDQKALQQLIQLYNKKPSIREYKIGRNDLCPCGSGLKYKNCCLKSGKYEKLTKEKK